jgi:hypothetical protein
MGTERRKGRPAPGTILGVIAIVLALTGVATGLPGKRSIDKNDLRKNVVKSPQIKNGQVKTGDLADNQVTAADLADNRVVQLNLINAWTSNQVDSPGNVPAAVKDGFGFVHLEGLITRTGGASSKPFELPAGFRPAHKVFEDVDLSFTTHGRIVIQTTGVVDIFGGTAGSIEGVIFRAAG